MFRTSPGCVTRVVRDRVGRVLAVEQAIAAAWPEIWFLEDYSKSLGRILLIGVSNTKGNGLNERIEVPSKRNL